VELNELLTRDSGHLMRNIDDPKAIALIINQKCLSKSGFKIDKGCGFIKKVLEKFNTSKKARTELLTDIQSRSISNTINLLKNQTLSLITNTISWHNRLKTFIEEKGLSGKENLEEVVRLVDKQNPWKNLLSKSRSTELARALLLKFYPETFIYGKAQYLCQYFKVDVAMQTSPSLEKVPESHISTILKLLGYRVDNHQLMVSDPNSWIFNTSKSYPNEYFKLARKNYESLGFISRAKL